MNRAQARAASVNSLALRKRSRRFRLIRSIAALLFEVREKQQLLATMFAYQGGVCDLARAGHLSKSGRRIRAVLGPVSRMDEVAHHAIVRSNLA
jgi:hypothetical protein